MSENKHTPGPWVIGRPPPNGEQTIGDKNGLMVAVATTGYGVNSEANARRIVACVNACAGITTEQLERSKSLDEFMRSMKVIEQQRDLAVEALEKQGHSAGCRKNAFGDICSCGLDDLLSTIKESEAMAQGDK